VYLPQIKCPEVLGVMRDLKALLDPRGILNPHKFLPPE
jgi:FAD/FMN-containing dehydrogenase